MPTATSEATRIPLSIPPLMLSVAEAAQAIRMSESYLYELLAAKTVRSIKVGRRRLVELESLKEWHKRFTTGEGLQGGAQ